jgi:hypothetical protein
MAIFFPDILKHGNPNYAVIDSDSLRGGIRTAVANLTALYQLSASPAQAGTSGTLKSYSTKVWVTSENQFYTLVDESNSGKAVGWVADNLYGNTNFFNKISGDIVTGNSGFTKNVTISGALSSSGGAYFKDAFFYSGTALALSGVFYGDGRNLLGSAFDQDDVNAWVRSNSSVAIGFTTLSAKNVYGDFLGSENFKTNNATEIATNVAQSSATFHGVFYGDGRRLLGSAFDQDIVNAWVRSNSSVAISYDTLSAKNIYGDFLGSEFFKANNSTEIATNTAQSSATFHGVFYGDGRRLLGSAFDQDIVNTWVRSNSSVATAYDTLSSKTINGDFIGTTLFETQSANVVTTNTALGSATFHGTYYGNGEYLDNITVGSRRFEYIPLAGTVPAHSYSGATRSVYTTINESKWKIVKMEYDTDGTVLGLSAAVGVTWAGRTGHLYT